MAAVLSRRRRRKGAAANSHVAGSPRRRLGRGSVDDRRTRLVEQQGQARARLAAGVAQLARGVPWRADRCERAEAPFTRERRETVIAASTFESLRPMLFSIAYRMLGSVSEAEDVVQEAFLRAQRGLEGDAEVQSPKAYLSAVVTRLSIDQLRSARAKREVYTGEWLPEPVLTEGG